jgi:hypothetical protein
MIDQDEKLLPSQVRVDRLVRVLSDQRRVLATAGSNARIVDEYGALIQFLKSATSVELCRIFPNLTKTRKKGIEEPEWSEEQLADLSAVEVQRFIADESTSRKSLERIAIYRFRVPRGSMRSFSNRDMLIEKLSTLLRNEQAHTTIETVARGQGELRVTRS